MVSDGQMKIVGLQRVCGTTPHGAYAEGMVVSGVKVCIVANLHREVGSHAGPWHKSVVTERRVVLEEGRVLCVFRQQVLDGSAGVLSDGTMQCSKGVEGRLRKDMLVDCEAGEDAGEIRVLRKDLQIENVGANGRDSMRTGVSWSGENAKGDVGQGKVAIGVDAWDPSLEGGHFEDDTVFEFKIMREGSDIIPCQLKVVVCAFLLIDAWRGRETIPRQPAACGN